MKKIVTKITSAIVAVVVVLSMFVTAFASYDGTTAQALRFDSEGKLKIMHVTDTHLDVDNVDASVWLISVVTGRQIAYKD